MTQVPKHNSKQERESDDCERSWNEGEKRFKYSIKLWISVTWQQAYIRNMSAKGE